MLTTRPCGRKRDVVDAVTPGDRGGRPVLNQLNLVVGDMEAMAAFYRLLGVEIGAPPAPWDQHHRTAEMPGRIDLDLDSGAFAAEWNAGWPPGRTGAVIGFGVPSREAVDERYETLAAAGYATQQPPYDAFWGARYAVVVDPDGNAVGLMSPIDEAHRSAPPEPPS